MAKNINIGILGHAGHGKTTLALSLLNLGCDVHLLVADAHKADSIPLGISKETWKEYKLIKQKTSKLSARKREYVVYKVEKSLKR